MKLLMSLGSKLAIAALVVTLALGLATSASAATINFDQAMGPGGTLTYGGELGNILTGTDIMFDEVYVGGAGAKDGEYVCVECKLNFETSGSTGQFSAEGPVPSLVTFGAGGSFLVTGTILDGDGVAINTLSNVLLEGTFRSAALISLAGRLIFDGTGTDTKNEEFLDFLGLTLNDFNFSNTEILGQGSFGPGAFQVDGLPVFEADITNSQVPEPSTLLMSGIALLILGFLRRRHA